MKKVRALCTLLFPFSLAALAADTPWVCFGNEPSWRLEFPQPGTARLSFPGESPEDFLVNETRLPAQNESAWRGRPLSGGDGVLVAWVRETSCSDGMSDAKHPAMARVSLPDGRLLAGCCRIPSAAAQGVLGLATLEGTNWRLASLTGVDGALLASAARPVTARFASGRIEGFSGCNVFTGAYTLSADRISFNPVAGTLMACPSPAMEIENAFKGALTGTLRYAISENRLTLTAASGATLVFAAQPPAALEGFAGSVTGYNNGRHAVVSPLLGTELTLSFGEGVVSGQAGCNTYRAPFTRDGDRVRIAGAVTTRKACQGEGIMEQEREFLAALETATTWEIRDGILDMHRADGERVLTARARSR